jgi:thiol-disulfide isomerase/thioredoxin
MKIPLIAFFLASALSSQVISGTPGEVKIGNHLREMPLHNFDGRTNSLSDYKGKPLIINVWASWCGPCRAEMDSLERLARRYNGKEFNVIGVSTDDDRYAAAAFIRHSGVTFDNFHDRKLLLENMLGANTIPLTILVDADGRVLNKIRGSREWDSNKIIDNIEKTFHITPAHDPMSGLRIIRL